MSDGRMRQCAMMRCKSHTEPLPILGLRTEGVCMLMSLMIGEGTAATRWQWDAMNSRERRPVLQPARGLAPGRADRFDDVSNGVSRLLTQEFLGENWCNLVVNGSDTRHCE